MGFLYVENLIILTSTVFLWYTRVTDRRTDRRTIAYTRYSIYAVARKKFLKSVYSYGSYRKIKIGVAA